MSVDFGADTPEELLPEKVAIWAQTEVSGTFGSEESPKEVPENSIET